MEKLVVEGMQMSRPDFYGIYWEINKWMKLENQANFDEAMNEWCALYEVYQRLGYKVDLIKAVPGLHDMSFTANGPLMIDKTAIMPRFKHQERQGEVAEHRKWVESRDYETIIDADCDWEGPAETIINPRGKIAFHTFGVRSSKDSAEFIQKQLPQYQIIPLELATEEFYHGDTCLVWLDGRTIAYYPRAFTVEAQKAVENSGVNIIEVDEESAIGFACNSVVLMERQAVVCNDEPATIDFFLKEAPKLGLSIIPTRVRNFKNAGGSAKCLTNFRYTRVPLAA